MRLRSLVRCRSSSAKLLGISFFVVSLIIYCYFYSFRVSPFQSHQGHSLYHRVQMYDGASEDRAKFMAMLLAAQDVIPNILCAFRYCYMHSLENNDVHRSTNGSSRIAQNNKLSNALKCYKSLIQHSRSKPHPHMTLTKRQKEMFQLLEGGSTCSALETRPTDIDTMETYPTFDFMPGWLRSREFWDKDFEDRFTRISATANRLPLKVIIVPHSHNDPGWLQTFESYFALKTKNIINNIVQKLKQYPNMTFIWTEMSYLHEWWESAHPTKQKILKELIEEGRLEITTGGWVMPDEANTHIYALIDQLIEGHLWVNITLGVTPKTGWSIDPFGHGPTVPYLLSKSGIKGTIIQRIHYAWKQYLAHQQMEDFYWMPGWQSMYRPTMITHNQPFDIYSIKSSCGPHPSVCLSFDFRRIPGEYTEFSVKHDPITAENVQSKSKILMNEYNRIGSLTKHNVVLVPLGDDFRYEHDVEFDEQYENYNKLITYINSHKSKFNAEISFGTPKDYFNALLKRQNQFPSLKGDFFVYADIYSEGKPAYWSGFYTTRPYVKILARQLEHNLRNSEILFTLVSNLLKKVDTSSSMFASKRLDKHYEELITARRNLGLFQHHDAITGTSKAAVMHDYGTKLFTSLYHCSRIQEMALSTVLLPDLNTEVALQTESEWETYGNQPHKMNIDIKDLRDIVLFNSLGQNRTDVMTILSNTSTVTVYNHFTKEYIEVQINPVVEIRPDGQYKVSKQKFEIVFIAEIPGLTSVTFTLRNIVSKHQVRSSLFCNVCSSKSLKKEKRFIVKQMLPGDILLENKRIKILINRNTGFLKRIHRKSLQRKYVCEVQFGAYHSAQRHSGAYLFMPDFERPERDVLDSYISYSHGTDAQLIIVTGPLITEIKTLYVPFLTHKIRIHNTDHAVLAESIYMENIVDFEAPPKNRETELFLRLQTNIQNGDIPEFYTDQNGFQFQKRVKVTKLNIEANYYPITTMAFLQDEQTRITFVTDHAQGASAFEPGRLEIMFDRRTLYDDYRGMGEGVVDNKLTVFKNWILLEAFSEEKVYSRFKRDIVTPVSFHRSRKTKTIQYNDNSQERDDFETTPYHLPSSTANQLSRQLNYPVNTFIVDLNYSVMNDSLAGAYEFFKNFPTDLHLINLRTITDNIYDIPGRSSLMIIQRQANSCLTSPILSADDNKGYGKFTKDSSFTNLTLEHLSAVSLTGLYTEEVLETLSDIKVSPMEIQCYKLTF